MFLLEVCWSQTSKLPVLCGVRDKGCSIFFHIFSVGFFFRKRRKYGGIRSLLLELCVRDWGWLRNKRHCRYHCITIVIVIAILHMNTQQYAKQYQHQNHHNHHMYQDHANQEHQHLHDSHHHDHQHQHHHHPHHPHHCHGQGNHDHGSNKRSTTCQPHALAWSSSSPPPSPPLHGAEKKHQISRHSIDAVSPPHSPPPLPCTKQKRNYM